jgi:hypothetical protein
MSPAPVNAKSKTSVVDRTTSPAARKARRTWTCIRPRERPETQVRVSRPPFRTSQKENAGASLGRLYRRLYQSALSPVASLPEKGPDHNDDHGGDDNPEQNVTHHPKSSR